MSNAAQQLEYAPSGPQRRRRIVRRAILAAGFLLVAIVLFRMAPGMWDRVQLLADQRRCLDHTQPLGAIVYQGATAFGYVPPYWPNYYAHFSGAGLTSRGTVFLHERADESGQRWLVAADLVTADLPGNSGLAVHLRQFSPGTLFVLPSEYLDASRRLLVLGPVNRVFAGQADPENPSHFWFEYERKGERKRIDCWITEQGFRAFGEE